MKAIRSAFLLLAFSLTTASAADLIKLERTYANLETPTPIAVITTPDESSRQLLALQRGQVMILPTDEEASEAEMFLDLSGRGMEADNGKFEEGLNGFAFHPQFAENGKFYLCYTQQMPKRLVISEMRTASGAFKAGESTERVLLEIPLVNWNHHGGNLLFGPDGCLYIGVGDNSKRNDELRLAQNNASLNGKILRIDVNKTDWHGGRYGIPDDNPYADGVNALPQIYASGIRNPWGLHFDDQGRLWCADVGQDLWEEINWIVKGGNYGWSHLEGSRAFTLRPDADPASGEYLPPLFEYNHGEGLSITGGIIYKGAALPDLKGTYVYGDFVLGKIWALRLNGEDKVESNTLLYTSPQEPPANPKKKPSVLVKPTAFCEDLTGEILVLDWNGSIYRMVP